MLRQSTLTTLAAVLLVSSPATSQQTDEPPADPVETRAQYAGEKFFTFYKDLSHALRLVDDDRTTQLSYDDKAEAGLLDSAFLLEHYGVTWNPGMLDRLRAQALLDEEELAKAREAARSADFLEGLREHTRAKAEATANALRILQENDVDVQALVDRIVQDPTRSGSVTWFYDAPSPSEDRELQESYWAIVAASLGVELDPREEY